MKLGLLIISLLVASCTLTTKQDHAQIAHQRLVPRPGYEGHLTNRVCVEMHRFNGCKKWSIQKHNINDKQTRVNLNDFGIACQINGKRFRVDIERPGFVRIDPKCTKHEKWWGNDCKRWDRNETFIPISRYQFLMDAMLECKQGF